MVYIPFVDSNPADKIHGYTPTEQKTMPPEETGWDRLHRIIQPDEFGGYTPEVETVLQVGCMSLFVGALYGGVIESRSAYEEFFRNNQATIFKDHLEAKKKMQDKVTLSFAKGAFRWGWRLSAFSMSYLGIATGIATYRGKSGILEYVIAGGLTGAGYKWKMGPSGWVIGGGLGTVLGFIAGALTQNLLKLTGMTMTDVRQLNTEWTKKRTETYEKGIKEYVKKEELELLREREAKMIAESIALDDIKS